LCSRGKATAIDVDGWSLRAVEDFLQCRFGNREITDALALRLERHTNGNPLFLEEIADHLVRAGHLRRDNQRWTFASGIPPSQWNLPGEFQKIVREWLPRQTSAAVAALEAASLIEGEFTVQEIASATGRAELEIDTALAEVARGTRLIESVGSGRWPDLTATQTYRFTHALYQRALADGVAPLRRQALHLRIAERVEVAFESQPGKVAARLAGHFHAAGDEAKRIDYLEIAAATAVGRYAYGEAQSCLLYLIEALRHLPASAAGKRREACRWIDYAHLTSIRKGIPDPDVKRAYQSALQAAEEGDDDVLRVRAMFGCMSVFGYGGELARATEVGEQLIAIADQHPPLIPAAHVYVAMTESGLGKIRQSYQRVRRVMDMEAEPNLPATWDLQLGGTLHIAWCAAMLGQRAEMEDALVRALERVRQTSLPVARVSTAIHIAAIHLWSREFERAGPMATEAVVIADEIEIAAFQTVARILHARARHERDPARFIDEVEQQLLQRAVLGERWWDSLFYGWLAEAYRDDGQLARALERTEDALALEEQSFRSESLRIRGTILAAQGEVDAAEACLRESLAVAAAQEAPAFQLRTGIALSELLRRRKGNREARELLQRLCDQFPEAAPVDYAEARALGTLR